MLCFAGFKCKCKHLTPLQTHKHYIIHIFSSCVHMYFVLTAQWRQGTKLTQLLLSTCWYPHFLPTLSMLLSDKLGQKGKGLYLPHISLSSSVIFGRNGWLIQGGYDTNKEDYNQVSWSPGFLRMVLYSFHVQCEF